MLKSLLLICITFLIVPGKLSAQKNNASVKGKVITKDGKPAAGVTIQALGTAYRAFTKNDGTFNMSVEAGTYTIRYSALGMVATEQSILVKAGEALEMADVTLSLTSFQLKEVVVTGQYAPQSLKNSVYMVRTISSEQIKLRNPTKVQEVLNDQLGFRFSNDLTLGTSNITLMGIDGQRVKILLDGVPLLDRGETRESLNQIDVNTIDHIEIVEGPMSVSYGSDALAGVINLITKKSPGGESFQVNARVQEETAGKQYQALQESGTHLANMGVSWSHQNWQLLGNVTRNNFDGAQQGWIPKNQYLGSAAAGYQGNAFRVWYRFDGENETLKSNGTIINPETNNRTDARYITYRWMHQLQTDWQINNSITFSGAASYTDYSRRTQTTAFNVLTGDRRLTLGAGEQDESVFDAEFFRGTLQYKVAESLSLQPGVEINLTGSSGARIAGSPSINDYALFMSAEWKPVPIVSVRPGARFIKNSVYDAPPVIPSINTKIILSHALDLRLAYARGFRSPALRELYFNFVDASHRIFGNENLKAEFSNSVNGSLSWQSLSSGTVKIKSALSGFFNAFNNLITTGNDPADLSRTTYINVDKVKTTGGSVDNTLYYQSLQVKLGFSYIGVYRMLQNIPPDQINYTWYPELSSTLLYHFKKLKGDVSFFYKYNGALPTYETVSGSNTVNLAKRAAFSWADVTLNKVVNHNISLAAGVKNLFNITNVNNTSLNVGGAHSTGGPAPLGYGRSYFLGLNFQFSKN